MLKSDSITVDSNRGLDGSEDSRRAESLLKTSALQDAIFSSAVFSSIATDENGVIQIFNVGAERMLGYAATDVLNLRTHADFSDPEELIARAATLSLDMDRPIAAGFDALVFKASRGIEDIYELTYIRKDGSRVPAIVSVTALRDVRDKVIGYLMIATDNTARKQLETAQTLLDQRLRDQQFYTRTLIESSIDALMVTDRQGNITDVNRCMMTLTGHTRDELIGVPCRHFFTDPIRVDAAIKHVLTDQHASDFELLVRAQNGDEIVVSCNAATFHDRDRKVQGVVVTARDVTERKRTERGTEAKIAALEKLDRMKSERMAAMAVEMHTPLHAIIGFAEALKTCFKSAKNDVEHEHVHDILTSAQHLLSLINDIQDLSKIEPGMKALDVEAIDLNVRSNANAHAPSNRRALERGARDDANGPPINRRKIKRIV